MFKDVIGQEEIKERLIASAQSGRVSHAQLFAGSTGAGTLALALALTQYLLCTGEKRGDACGTCPECRKMQKLIHPDVHFVFPVVKSAKVKSPVSDEYAREWREMLLRSPYVDMEDWLAAMGADENAQALIYTEESGNILRKLSLKPSSSLSRHLMTSTAESVCAMAVAAATPATLILKMMTKTRSSTTLVTPAASRKKSGLLVSPLALRIALPKL